jgi:hypothetical protein
MNNKSSIFSDHHIRPELSASGTKNTIAKFLGFAQIVEKIHYGGTRSKANLFLIYLKDLNKSTKQFQAYFQNKISPMLKLRMELFTS